MLVQALLKSLGVLSSDLLLLAIIMRPLLKRLCIEAHIPRRHDTTALPLHLTSLGIDNRVAALGSLNELGILLLEDLEIALGLPVPDGVSGEDEVHLLERALVGFRVEGPDDDDRGGVNGAEEVQGLFAQAGEDGWEKEHLGVITVSPFLGTVFDAARSKGMEHTVQPLPIDQPTTPHALPLARTSKGKISAG